MKLFSIEAYPVPDRFANDVIVGGYAVMILWGWMHREQDWKYALTFRFTRVRTGKL